VPESARSFVRGEELVADLAPARRAAGDAGAEFEGVAEFFFAIQVMATSQAPARIRRSRPVTNGPSTRSPASSVTLAAWTRRPAAERQRPGEEYDRFTAAHPRMLTAAEREQIRALASHPTDAHRKQLIRHLVEQFGVAVAGTSEKVDVKVAWAGEHRTARRSLSDGLPGPAQLLPPAGCPGP